MTKYRAQATEVDGVRFHSKAEARRFGQLKMLEKAGVISGLQRQVPFKVFVNGGLLFTYYADACYWENGKRVIEDTKGVRTPLYRAKKKGVELQYPGVVIQEVRA